MKITIEPTEHITQIAHLPGQNARARLWRGTMESGHEVVALVAMISAVTGSEADAALAAELLELRVQGGDELMATVVPVYPPNAPEEKQNV